MQLDAAERFLKNHFQDDALDTGEVRRTAERFEMIMGNAARFPNADLETIDAYLDAAYSWLGGLSHRFEVEA